MNNLQGDDVSIISEQVQTHNSARLFAHGIVIIERTPHSGVVS